SVVRGPSVTVKLGHSFPLPESRNEPSSKVRNARGRRFPSFLCPFGNFIFARSVNQGLIVLRLDFLNGTNTGTARSMSMQYICQVSMISFPLGRIHANFSSCLAPRFLA